MSAPAKSREPLHLFLARAVAVTLLIVVTVGGCNRWVRLGFDLHGNQCLPYKAYLIVRGHAQFKRGDFIVFRSDPRQEPFYRLGSQFVKRVEGVQGDRVEVTPQGEITVAGRVLPGIERRVVHKLGMDVQEFARNETVQPGFFWAMGNQPGSFDSRYWGFVSADQVIGKGYPIF